MRGVRVVLTEIMIYFLLNKTYMHEPYEESLEAHESAHTSHGMATTVHCMTISFVWGCS